MNITGIWEMNQGLVDKDGHWHPIYSSGCDGIDQDDWYERKIRDLNDYLGYDVRPVEVQHSEILHNAVKEVFGKEWYEVNVDHDADPRVKKLMKKEDARYDEFREKRDGYKVERMHRLDDMFMEALKRENESERPTEIGLLDDEHIKETCRLFCESYSGNVGMMTNCLDKMAKMGYDVWCTCSDCGEQFQCCDFETFGCSIDRDAYTGDGGIGVIMKRVLCDECRQNAECHKCWELDRPNERRKDGRNDWDDYDFLACVMLDWLDVCWGCADGFKCDELKRWDEATNQRVNTKLGKSYYNLAERISEENGGLEGHALYEELKKTKSGQKRINEIRDLLEEAAENHFGDSLDDDWFVDRYDVEDKRQMKLPGME